MRKGLGSRYKAYYFLNHRELRDVFVLCALCVLCGFFKDRVAYEMVIQEGTPMRKGLGG